MRGTFYRASDFNGDISKWTVSSVTDMSVMFSNAEQFNGYISNWDVSKVATMHQMFALAAKFNQDISKWDVSRVTDMTSMFHQASAFSQTLCGAWSRPAESAMQTIFLGSSGKLCSGELIISWFVCMRVRDTRTM